MGDKMAEAAYELNEVVCAFLNGEHPFDRADKAVNAYEALSALPEAQPVADEALELLRDSLPFLCAANFIYFAAPRDRLVAKINAFLQRARSAG